MKLACLCNFCIFLFRAVSITGRELKKQQRETETIIHQQVLSHLRDCHTGLSAYADRLSKLKAISSEGNLVWRDTN